MRYEEAKNMFENTRRRKLDNNTYLVKTDEGYGVRLHNTVVVEFIKDRVRLNTGGWKTLTTKDRINGYSPSRIFQKDHVWYLGSKEVPFFDGIEVSYRGRVIESKATKKRDKIVSKQQNMLKRIDSYVSGFMKEIEEGELPTPSGGDYWCCLMKTNEGKEIFNGSQHLLEHLKERYYVPSLLVNAIREKGYNPAFVNPWNGLRDDTKIFKKALRDFLIKRLVKGDSI